MQKIDLLPVIHIGNIFCIEDLEQGSPSSFEWSPDTVEQFERGPEKADNVILFCFHIV